MVYPSPIVVKVWCNQTKPSFDWPVEQTELAKPDYLFVHLTRAMNMKRTERMNYVKKAIGVWKHSGALSWPAIGKEWGLLSEARS